MEVQIDEDQSKVEKEKGGEWWSFGISPLTIQGEFYLFDPWEEVPLPWWQVTNEGEEEATMSDRTMSNLRTLNQSTC